MNVHADELAAELAHAIERHMTANGISQRKIAQGAGVAPSTVCRLLAGRVGISLESFCALTQHLGIELKLQRPDSAQVAGESPLPRSAGAT